MKFLFLSGLGLSLAACAQPTTSHLAQASDPLVRGKPVPVISTTAGTQDYRPVEPLDWMTINRRVAPPGSEP